MEVVILPGADDVADQAAQIVADTIATRAKPVIGLATGSSPLGTYQRLIERHRTGTLRFDSVTAVILDEYIGLPAGHPESYREVIRREFVDHLDLPIARLHSPDVAASDLAEACRAYDDTVTGLGVDVQLLGIGSDGHIGFNEPGSSLRSRTRIKTLTDRTRADNARFFSSIDEVPRHVVTQGLGTICDAGHLLLIASGASKAAPVAAAVEGPLTAMCPGSVLQLHPHVTVLVDEDAAADLRLTAYYRETLRHKPPWQPY